MRCWRKSSAGSASIRIARRLDQRRVERSCRWCEIQLLVAGRARIGHNGQQQPLRTESLMTIAIRCPHCDKAYNLKDELKGKRVACTNPNCKKVFTITPT